jgi:predicted alpha/beta superfamily hydrolase
VGGFGAARVLDGVRRTRLGAALRLEGVRLRGDATLPLGVHLRERNGRSYQILVGQPYKPEPGKRFATIYVLDGYWDFPLVNAMRGALQYDEAIPDVMIVGIGYGGKDPDVHALRASDYTPTAHASPADSGKAPDFLRFIETELFPYIESRYPSDPAQRVLAGASFGGLFALYALFEKPELFSGYVSMTPAVNWDDGWIFKREREFSAAKREPLAQRLWVSFGDSEQPERVKRGREFMKALESHKSRDWRYARA